MIPIFVAIDTPSYSAAEELLCALGDHVEIKIGLEFFVANGPDAVRSLRDIGATRPRQLFLDLKFHDIPNTVAGAVRSALSMEPDFLTLHTSEGMAPLKAAVEIINASNGKKPKLLGVTVLTSSESEDIVFASRVVDCRDAQLDGIICPPSRLLSMKNLWRNMFLMVPGIRMENSATHDQINVATARQAMEAGASALVIGRDITTAKNPLEAVLAIKKSME